MNYEQIQRKYYDRLLDLTAEELEGRKRTGEASAKRWKDPKWREMMLKKQRACGLRNYPNVL